MGAWSEADIPDLTGKRVIVTGASGGIGLEASRLFAAAGADVVLAVRNGERGRRAADAIWREVPTAKLEIADVDVTDLSSIERFAVAERTSGRGIDILVNNAGRMEDGPPGHDNALHVQAATNFVGTYALTGLLLPALRDGGRVITVTSRLARDGSLGPDSTLSHLRPDAGKNTLQRYADSKQASLLFAAELDRRLRAANRDVRSVACHPGVAKTGLYTQAARTDGRPERLSLQWRLLWPLFQPARAAAWPLLYAATAPEIHGGEFVGPEGMSGTRGRPRVIPLYPCAKEPSAGARVWELGREATGVEFAGL